MIDRDIVRHVAALARLELTADEEERLAADLARIVEMVDALPEVDPAELAAAGGVSEPGPMGGEDLPAAHATPEGGAAAAAGMDPPEPDPACTVPLGGLFERNAPAVEDGHLRLPPVRREPRADDPEDRPPSSDAP